MWHVHKCRHTQAYKVASHLYPRFWIWMDIVCEKCHTFTKGPHCHQRCLPANLQTAYLHVYISLHVYLHTCRPACLTTSILAYLPNCPQSTYLPICIFTYLTAYLHVCLSTYQSAYLPILLSAYLPTCIPICLHTCLSAYLHIYLPTSLPICLPAYLPSYLPA